MPKGQVPISKYIKLKQEVEKVAYQNGFDAGVEKAYKEGFQAGQQTATHANTQLLATQNELEQVRNQLQVAHNDFWMVAKERDTIRTTLYKARRLLRTIRELMDWDIYITKGEIEDASRPSSGYDSQSGLQNERSRD